MPTEIFVDVHNRQRYRVEYDTQIGGGGQAEVFRVRKVDNRQVGDHLLKIYKYPNQVVEQHAVKFVDHLNSHGLHKGGLVGLPRRVVVSEKGRRIAAFMAQVPGEELEGEREVYGWLQSQSLQVRLELAHQVADSIATLHKDNIVHADIAPPNVMLDRQNMCTYLIDADGGGILGQNGQYLLKPIVHGHPIASWNAPELYTPNTIASKETDNWSLAVLILKVLAASQYDPFGGLEVFFDEREHRGRDCRDRTLRWPDYQPDTDHPARQAVVDTFKRALMRLGPMLQSRFVATFDITGRLDYPRSRTLSITWSLDLDTAARWCFKCKKCGEQIVADGVTHCSFCQKALDHAQVRVGATTWIIHREGFSLVGRDLGFRDDNGRYEVLVFSRIIRRDRSKLRIEVLSTGEVYELDSGVYDIDVRSRDRRSRTVARVTVT